MIHKLPVRPERDLAQRNQINQIHYRRHSPRRAEHQHKTIQRNHSETIEQIRTQIQQPYNHFPHEFRQRNVKQHTRIRLKHRHVQNKESQRQQQIHIINQQRCLFGIIGHHTILEHKKQQCQNRKTYQWQQQRPPHKTMILQLGILWSAKPRIKTHYRRICSQLCQPGKKHRRINHHARQANLFAGQQISNHKKSSHCANQNPKVIGQCTLYALFCYYAHLLDSESILTFFARLTPSHLPHSSARRFKMQKYYIFFDKSSFSIQFILLIPKLFVSLPLVNFGVKSTL